MTASDFPSTNGRPESGAGNSLPERPKSRTMPSYYHSNEMNAVKKLRRTQEEEVTQSLLLIRDEKKLHTVGLENEAKRLMRKVPLDILTMDWCVTTVDTVEMRSYLVDKVLPQLVLALEKLLVEADKRGLPYVAERKAAKVDIDPDKELELQKVEKIIESKREKRMEDEPSFDADFNPINYLARFLMRNNPRFNNHLETSPYVRGLKAVNQQLRQMVFSSEENKLAAIKLEAKKKREEREEKERARLAELERKEANLSSHFYTWVYPKQLPPPEEMDPHELIQVAYIQNALRSFEEMAQKLPPEMKDNAKFDAEIEPTDSSGSTVNMWQFQKFLMKYVHGFSHEMFDLFISHLQMCAEAYHEANRIARRQKIYTDLFNYLDTNIGFINRKTILQLLKLYYFKCDKQKRSLLRDPRKWPVVEINEADEHAEEPFSNEEEANEAAEESAEVEQMAADAELEEQEANNDDEMDPPVQQEQQQELSLEANVEAAELVQEQETKPAEESAVTQTGLDEVPNILAAADNANMDMMLAPEDTGAALESTGEGGPNETTPGDAVDEDEAEGSAADKEEVATIKAERDIIQEIKRAELERERTDKLEELIPKEKVAPFFEDMLNRDQFALLVENFLGEKCEDKTLYSFISYIKQYYVEAETDKLDRLTKVNTTAQEKFNKHIVEQLFTTWDSDGKGFIELPQFIVIAERYKDGAEQEALETALDEVGSVPDNQLRQGQFVELIRCITKHLTDGEEQLQAFVEFLNDSLDKSHEEKIRGLARKKWLDEITTAAQVTGDMEAVYKAVFNALYKDAEAHGRNKKISANICLLESNPDAHADAPEIPAKILRCVAATVEDAAFVLGCYITEGQPSVSFPAMTQRELMHVPKVKSHGSVHFFNTRRADRDGSLVVCPILDARRNAYGTLAVDTVRTQNRETGIFLQHELAFIQGVAQKFNEAYTLIDIKRRSLKIVESCIKWIKLNCPSVRECTFFVVEYDPVNPHNPFTLRMMLGSDYQGFVTYFKNSKALALQDNMFKEYLYKAVTNSETVVGEMMGQYHMACPIRDNEGFSRCVMDVNIGPSLLLNKVEKIELLRMLKIQQDSFTYMNAEATGKATQILDVEKEMGRMSVEILFERMMLLEVRQAVSEIKAETFAEIKSYNQPPEIAIQIVQILIEMFLSRSKDQFSNWNSMKLVLSAEMLKKVVAFDPTAPTTIDITLLRDMIDKISKERLSTMGPFPAQILHNWLMVAISLMEHADFFRVQTASGERTNNEIVI